MAQRDDINLCLVLEVEKHQCLYNYNLPEYSRIDVSNKAWSEISSKIRLPVNDCKEKWRNIRSAFLRSLKGLEQRGITSKVKRPYYLSEYLHFVQPFMKPHNQSINATEENSELSDTDETNQDSQSIISQRVASPILDDKRRKRPVLEVERSFEDYLSFKRSQRETESPIESNKNPMHHFLLSLLPEFETMSQDQLRYFKIEVMLLIDRIKTNQVQGRSFTDNNYSVEVNQLSPEQIKAEIYSPNNNN